MSGTGTIFFTLNDIGGHTYSQNALTLGINAAKSAGVKLSQIGTVVDCPTLTDLTNLYHLFYTGTNASNFQVWNTLSTRFRDLGNRAYFKVKGMTVQVWALVVVVNGKLTEGSGQPPIWIPVYCSFDAIADPIFDSPRVASLRF